MLDLCHRLSSARTWCVLFCAALVPLTLMAQEEILPRPAFHAPKATQALTLDLIRAEPRWVAVGERGHVLLSEDGTDWVQAEFVPVQSTLTRVTAHQGHLWAVGHDSTIIHSHDGGQTWDLQWFAPELEQPFLDVHFKDRLNGIVIGAYGVYMITDDGGKNWQELNMADLVVSEAIDWEAIEASMLADDPDSMGFDRGCYEFMECHLNAFLDLGNGRYMIAAERGYGFRSLDAGESWESFRFSYPGSMFGLIGLPQGILAYGLRGQVQFSDDFGSSWTVLDSPSQSTLLDAAQAPDGSILMVGAGAARLSYRPDVQTFSLREDRLGNTLASVVFDNNGQAVFAGEEGISHD